MSQEYTKHQLKSGLNVVLYHRPEIHSVNIGIEVFVGAVDEDHTHNGISHLIEHVCFDGTEKYPSWQEFDTAVRSLSGSVNAYTSAEKTVFYGKFPHQYVIQSLELFDQLTLRPQFNEADIAKEKSIILDELAIQADQISRVRFNNLLEMRFKESTSYANLVVGTTENINNFNVEQVAKFRDQYYRPDNMKLAIVGNFDEKKVLDKLNTMFNSRKTVEVDHQLRQSLPSYSGFKSQSVTRDFDKTYFDISFPSLSMVHESRIERLAKSAVYDILVGNRRSILNSRLREELGLVYDIEYSGINWQKLSMNVVGVSCNMKHLSKIADEIYQGIEKLKAGDFDHSLLESKQKVVKDRQLMYFDNPSNALDWILEEEEELELGNQPLMPQEFVEMFDQIDIETVTKVATKIFDWQQSNWSLVCKEPTEKSKLILAGLTSQFNLPS